VSRRAPRLEPGLLSLLAEVLRGVPRLEGALCASRSQLFDAEQSDHDERLYAIARVQSDLRPVRGTNRVQTIRDD
jgi:hypothetical protein